MSEAVNDYKKIQTVDGYENNINETKKKLQESDEEIIELGNEFDFDGFQVVRREFFAHTKEPSASFSNCKFYVNAACLSRFPEVDFVQALVNQETKILALRPCEENDRDAIMWCNSTKGKRKVKQITCKLFFAKIFTLMDWNPEHRYKLLGKVIHANGEYLIAFDLTSTEVYQRVFKEGEKPKTSRTPVFPVGWQDQFGLPYEEHRRSMQVNIFEGYAVYAIKDTKHKEIKDSDVTEISENSLLNGHSGGDVNEQGSIKHNSIS